MNLAYITRVAIPSRAAQSRQLTAMSIAFHRRLGDKYRLVSAKSTDGVRCSFEFRWEPRTSLANPLLHYLRFGIYALRYAATNQGSVIFTRDIGVAFLAIVVGGHAVFEAHKEPIGLAARSMVKILSRCSRFRIVVISNALSHYYESRFNFDRGRVLVAHDGVFPEDYVEAKKIGKKALRVSLGLPVDRQLVVHTGSLSRGGAELFEYLLRVGREDVLFIHMGGSESECAHWATYYEARGHSNIRFIPHQPIEQARRYQVSADLLFYVITRDWPTYWCASPLKVFEYMASGVPIIGSAIGSISELLNEGNAYCYDPDDPSTIEAAWNRYQGDPDGARCRAERACQDARNRYSWHQRAEQIVTFCQELHRPL